MFRKLNSIFTAALAAASLTGLAAAGASAQYFGGEVDINLDTNSDQAVFAAEANVTGRVGGDLAVFAADIDINVDAGNDVAAFGADITLNGDIMGDAATAGADVSVGANVMGDLAAFGADVNITGLIGGELESAGAVVHVERTAVVNGPATLQGDAVLAEGRFVGPVDIAADELVLGGVFDGRVEVYARDVTIGPDAVIVGPITVRGPNAPVIEAGAQVPEIEYIEERFDESRIDHDFDVPVDIFPGFWAVGALYGSAAFILGLFIALLFPRSLARMSNRFRARPWVSAGLGLILWATMWMLLLTLAVLLAITIIGALLTPFVILAIPFVYFLAYIFGGVVVGDMIFNRSGDRAGLLIRIGSLLAVLLVIAALHVVPPIGLLVGLIVTFLGFGAWALAIFDRHRPNAEPLEAGAV